MSSVQRAQLKDYLRWLNVAYHTDTKVVEIKDDEVVAEGKNGPFAIKANTVVLALGYKANHSLADELVNMNCQVITIGGAVKTSNALVASRQGFDAGMTLK